MAVLTFCTYCALLVSKDLRMKVPTNYYYLFGFTLGESVMVAGLAAELTVESVLASIMATSVVTVCLFFGALYTATSTNSARLVRNLAFSVVGAVLV